MVYGIRTILLLMVSGLAMSLVAQTVTKTAKSTNQTAIKSSLTPSKPATKKVEKEIKWLSLKEAQELQKTTKKKIFIDVYTDWCGWCKKMDSSTFQSPEIVTYINEHYYAVKLNAEQKEIIEFNGKTYKNNNSGGRSTHEFASFILNNRHSYPTTVFMNEELELIQPIPGFLDATKLEPILHYFGSDSHKKMPWDAFEKEFQKVKNK
jgi:thioredoxin-related protein